MTHPTKVFPQTIKLFAAALIAVMLALAALIALPAPAYAADKLTFAGYEGASVTGSGTNPSNYTVCVRDGDSVYVTLKLANNSGEDLEFVRMVDAPAYDEGNSGLEAVDYREGRDEAFRPITFPPLGSSDKVDPQATDASYDKVQYLKTEETGVIMSGYAIASGAQPTFTLKVSAGDLPTGTYNWNIQLGRWRFEYDKVIEYWNGYPYESWPYARDEVEELYSAQIPLKVVVYSQEGASLSAGQGTGFDPVQTQLPASGIDFGTIDLSTATDDELTGSYDVNVINSGTPNVFTDDYGNSTSIKVVFDGENTRNGEWVYDGGAFAWGNGTLYDTNWDPLPPATTAGNSTSFQQANYTISYDVSDLIAGTYTGNFIINTTPHKVAINGVEGNDSGVYKYPITITLEGTNPRLLPPATNLHAEAGNGQVELTWTPGEGANEYTEYAIYRRDGSENQTNPNLLDWRPYEEIGTKVVGDPDDEGKVLFVDGDVENGKTYSYTVICGQPYRGYAATPASATPLSSYDSRMLAPEADTYDGLNCVEVSWEMNEHYGGSSSDGAGMVEYFNIYRDGVLVDRIYQSAVQDEVSYGWHDDGTGTGDQVYGVTGHSYSWVVEEPVPAPYVTYKWAVSAVSPSGVESYLSDGDYLEAQAYTDMPGIYTHKAWFDSTYRTEWNDDDAYTEYAAICFSVDTYGSGDSVESLDIWRAEGTSAPSTSGAPYATTDKEYTVGAGVNDYADENVKAGRTYTYTVQGTDEEGNKTNFYTFTVKAEEGQDFGTVDVTWSVVNSTTARMKWNCSYVEIVDHDYGSTDWEYTGTYKVYRNDQLIRTLTSSNAVDGAFDITDNPGSDGTYVYRVDKEISGVTMRGRDYTFVRNTQPVDVNTLTKVPDAPTLTGRTTGEINVILNWTPADSGGQPEGYHIYRKDADEQQIGGRYVTKQRWSGSYDVFERWGNGRYLTIQDAGTFSFVDGYTNSRPNYAYYKNDTHLGSVEELHWGEDSMPHEYYITAYNRAGESAPSNVIVFDESILDEYNNPIAKPYEADQAPSAPSVMSAWVEWDDVSSSRYGFDTAVGGNVRVAWSDPGFGGEIEKWTLTFAGGHWEDEGLNPPDTETLYYYKAAADPTAKLGTSTESPSCYVSADSGSDGDLGRTFAITVRAENSAGTATSEEYSLDILSFPRFYVLPDSGGAVLRWTDLFNDSTTQVTGWEVWRKTEYGLWERVQSLPGTLEYAGTSKDYYGGDVSYYEWADSGLDNGWTYEYKVVAKCADDVDRPSIVREVTPERTSAVEAPGAPQNLQAQVVNGLVVLSWDAPTSGGAVSTYCPQVRSVETEGYDIEWYYGTISNVSGGSTSVTWAPNSPGTYKILVYARTVVDGDDVPKSILPYELEGYDNSSEAMAAYDAMTDEQQADALYSNKSNIVEVTITQEDIDQRATDLPEKPSPTATPGDGQITLSWAACDGAAYYTIERYNYAYPKMSDVTIAAVAGQEAYTWTDLDAEPGVKYQYRVTARNSAGNGIYTDVYATATGKTRDQIAAESVSVLIEALPGPTTVGVTDSERVYEVKDLYDSLTAKQKNLIDDELVQKLLDDIEALENLQAAAQYQEQIDAVQALINALPSPATLDDEVQVQAAREALDELPAIAQRLVDANRLIDAENMIAALKKAAADEAAAAPVRAMIENLPSPVTLDDADDVAAARTAFDALTDDQKALISDELQAKLSDSETKIAELEKAAADEAAAAPVRAAIENLPEPEQLTLDDADDVAAAADALDLLTADQKALISDELQAKLSDCVAKIFELEKAAADEAAAAPVRAAIENLPSPVTLDDAEDVAAARTAFDALTDDQKSLISDDLQTKLSNSEARIAELKAAADQEAADAVADLIDALPSPADIEMDDAEAVDAAREAFDALTEDQKALVDGELVEKLEGCEARLAELATAHVRYRTGVEGNTTWQGWKYDGELSGTVGQSLRMEGLKIELEDAPYEGGIEYKSQLQSDGWEKSWKRDGALSGYNPQKTGGKRLEAVQIQLYGEMAEHYDVWYHLQVQRFGWMAWAKNGESSGTVGYAFRVEALEIVLAPKGSEAPTIGSKVASDQINMLSFVRARSYDNKVWQGAKGEGDVSGTRAQTKTQLRVGLASSSLTAAGVDRGDAYVSVRVYQGGKWSSWSTEDDDYMGSAKGKPITGIQAKLALRKGGSDWGDLDGYDLYYRVEVRESTKACWLGWAKNGQTAGQSNLNLEQLEFSLVPKGEPAPPTKASEIQGTIAHIKQTWVIERWPCNYPKPAYRF